MMRRLSLIERLASLLKLRKYPFVLHSDILRPDLIDKTASVKDSQLIGEIVVGERSIINKAMLNGKVTIGRNTTLWGPNISIYSKLNQVSIGNFCSIARSVSIQEYNHFVDHCSTYFILHHIFNEDWSREICSIGGINIGNDVWIGGQSSILSGVNIGDGVIIGANSVVVNDVPPYAIVGGSPARVLKYRFNDKIISRLLELQWWFWPIERILKNRVLFEGPLTIEKLDDIA